MVVVEREESGVELFPVVVVVLLGPPGLSSFILVVIVVGGIVLPLVGVGPFDVRGEEDFMVVFVFESSFLCPK